MHRQDTEEVKYDSLKERILLFRHNIYPTKSIYQKIDDKRGSMEDILYISTIGSLMHAMLCTRLDFAYAVRVARRF